MLILKIFLLSSSAVAFTHAVDPPKRAAFHSDEVYKGQPFERAFPRMPCLGISSIPSKHTSLSTHIFW